MKQIFSVLAFLLLVNVANAQEATDNILEQILPTDIVYGSADAPVTAVEYASLSCGHCKHFHEKVFAGIKESHIDTGKLRFIYRHFPLNLQALRASMLVDCVADDERQKLFLDALFKSQSEWAYQKTETTLMEKLETIAKIGGLEKSEFDACLSNKTEEDALLQRQLKAGKDLQVRSTPTVFLNGKKFNQGHTAEAFAKAIDALIP